MSTFSLMAKLLKFKPNIMGLNLKLNCPIIDIGHLEEKHSPC